MTDSARDRAPRPGKRERLVAAATELVHRQGIERTTLADIARAADVPAGNVYYYFKTKDDVIAAVIDAQAQRVTAALTLISDRHPSPKDRLKALITELTSESETIARYGCPLGTLCSELSKRADAPQPGTNGQPPAADKLMRLPVEWAEEQFRLLGRADAPGLALDLLAAYEGSAVLASAMRDPGILTGAAGRVSRWIDALDRPGAC